MASYSKRMMEEAAPWLACNPKGDLSLLKIPGLLKDTRRHAADPDAARLDQLETDSKTTPKLQAAIANLRRLTAERDETLEGLYKAEGEFENTVNSHKDLVPSHSKSDHEDAKYRLGRWFLGWGRSGYNVFDLSSDFTAAMLLTDPRELDISDVRLPFPGLLMIIPEGFAKGAEGRSYTKIHVTEVTQRDRRVLSATDMVAAAFNAMAPSQRPILAAALLKEHNSPTLQSTLESSQRGLLPVADSFPSCGVLHIYATDGAHALNTTIDQAHLTWDSFDALPSVEAPADQQVSHTIRQIVFGALAYATAVERAIEPREPVTRKGAKRDASPSPKHWDMGRTIRLDPRLVQAARSGSREIALRLKQRHIVRGHYRNQAHGIRRAERKKIWISCFWKGPEEGAALVHTYKLEAAPGVVGDGTSPTGTVSATATMPTPMDVSK